MTKIYSGFPGVGKTHCYKNSSIKILDSDSSRFEKKDFPDNYIRYIKGQIGKVSVIFVSNHLIVRNALIAEGLDFFTVYPNIILKQEYLERYRLRGDSDTFIKLISDNWEKWITDIDNNYENNHIVLDSGQYIGDII